LQHFAMVPVAVAADRRLGWWDLRVLIALLGTARWDKQREAMQPLRIRARTVMRLLEVEGAGARELVRRSLRHLEELEYLRRAAPQGGAGSYDLTPTWWVGGVDNLVDNLPGDGELPFPVTTVELSPPTTVELSPPPKPTTVGLWVAGEGREGETRPDSLFTDYKTRRVGSTPRAVDNLPGGATPTGRPSWSGAAKAASVSTARPGGGQADSLTHTAQRRHPCEGVPSVDRCSLVVGAAGVSRGGFLRAVRARPDLSPGQIARAAERFAQRAAESPPARPDRAWAGWVARERRG